MRYKCGPQIFFSAHLAKCNYSCKFLFLCETDFLYMFSTPFGIGSVGWDDFDKIVEFWFLSSEFGKRKKFQDKSTNYLFDIFSRFFWKSNLNCLKFQKTELYITIFFSLKYWVFKNFISDAYFKNSTLP